MCVCCHDINGIGFFFIHFQTRTNATTLRSSRRASKRRRGGGGGRRRHDRSDPQRPPREENTREVQRGRYHRRLEKARRGADRDEAGENTVRLSLSLSFAAREEGKKRPFETASPTFSRTDDASNIFSLSETTTTTKRIQKWYTIYKDHITLDDYEVKDGSNLELYYN